LHIKEDAAQTGGLLAGHFGPMVVSMGKRSQTIFSKSQFENNRVLKLALQSHFL
jgi:hypothetical protein